MKKIILIIVGIATVFLFGYTIYFLIDKAKTKPTIYETLTPTTETIILK